MLKDKDLERFVGKINKTDTCWLWTGAPTKKGYGQFKYQDMNLKAHRVSYALWKGELDEELCIMHECDNKICVNPDHLEQGTTSKNTSDAYTRGLKDHTGTGNPSSKLNERQVREIRALGELGVPRNRIAQMYNMSERAIYSIHHRKSWTHVD